MDGSLCLFEIDAEFDFGIACEQKHPILFLDYCK